jgi:hypothetical protein
MNAKYRIYSRSVHGEPRFYPQIKNCLRLWFFKHIQIKDLKHQYDCNYRAYYFTSKEEAEQAIAQQVLADKQYLLEKIIDADYGVKIFEVDV